MSNYNPKSLKAEEFLKQLNMPKRTNIMWN